MRSARLLTLLLGTLLLGIVALARPAGAVGNPDYTVPPPATVVARALSAATLRMRRFSVSAT